MVFNHSVKYNGVVYPTGADVPVGDTKTESKPIVEEKHYTKTEIARMTTAELKELATDIGIDDAINKSGKELKKLLSEHYGL